MEGETVELTFGGKAVGLNFNPSNDGQITRAKEYIANAID